MAPVLLNVLVKVESVFVIIGVILVNNIGYFFSEETIELLHVRLTNKLLYS
jgi:hypothetical protein